MGSGIAGSRVHVGLSYRVYVLRFWGFWLLVFRLRGLKLGFGTLGF